MMKSDNCIIFLDQMPALELLFNYWEKQGLYISNPLTKKMTCLDEEGNQYEIFSVKKILLNPLPSYIQMWLSKDTDIVLSFKEVNGFIQEEYIFDGLNYEERIFFIKKIFERLLSNNNSQNIVGCFFDYKQHLLESFFQNNIQD